MNNDGYYDAPEPTDYFEMLEDLAKKWLSIHLTHNVSLTATYEFWKLALKAMPKLMEVKKAQNIDRKTQQLVHLRRQIINEMCPEVYLKFIYLKLSTNETITVDSTKITPVKKDQSNPDYVKLCETAEIKVRNSRERQ